MINVEKCTNILMNQNNIFAFNDATFLFDEFLFRDVKQNDYAERN